MLPVLNVYNNLAIYFSLGSKPKALRRYGFGTVLAQSVWVKPFDDFAGLALTFAGSSCATVICSRTAFRNLISEASLNERPDRTLNCGIGPQRGGQFRQQPENPGPAPLAPLATIDTFASARLGPTRIKGNAQPAVFNREIAMYLAKHAGGRSTTAIGKFYDGRHHTTVLRALTRVQCLRARDARIDGLLSSLTQEIQSRQILPEWRHGPQALQNRGASALVTADCTTSSSTH